MLRMSDQAFLDVIDANLTGSFRVAKRAVAKMLRLHTGRIIFLSSVGAFVGLPGQANYAASKAGPGRDGPGHRPRGGQPADHRQRGGSRTDRHRHDDRAGRGAGGPA